MSLKPHELKLAAKLLRLASEEFANHGCNDFDLVIDGELTSEQAYEVNKAWVDVGLLEESGLSKEGDDALLRNSDAIAGDAGLMEWLAARLEEASKHD